MWNANCLLIYLRLPPVKRPLGWNISPSRLTLGVRISRLKATYKTFIEFERKEPIHEVTVQAVCRWQEIKANFLHENSDVLHMIQRTHRWMHSDKHTSFAASVVLQTKVEPNTNSIAFCNIIQNFQKKTASNKLKINKIWILTNKRGSKLYSWLV